MYQILTVKFNLNFRIKFRKLRNEDTFINFQCAEATDHKFNYRALFNLISATKKLKQNATMSLKP